MLLIADELLEYNSRPAWKVEEEDMHRSVGSLICCTLLIAMLNGVAVAPAASQQQAPATKVTSLLKQVLAELPGREVVMITLDIPPGGGSPPHRHPGHYIFGYVLEGTYKIKLDQGAETIVSKGQIFYEAPGQLHAISANASQTEPAKVLVFIVAESGKPITVPEPQ
jgi:quercetin dioxygenase-like cupin family protein